jgi:hypothetical protein
VARAVAEGLSAAVSGSEANRLASLESAPVEQALGPAVMTEREGEQMSAKTSPSLRKKSAPQQKRRFLFALAPQNKSESFLQFRCPRLKRVIALSGFVAGHYLAASSGNLSIERLSRSIQPRLAANLTAKQKLPHL